MNREMLSCVWLSYMLNSLSYDSIIFLIVVLRFRGFFYCLSSVIRFNRFLFCRIFSV